MNHYKKAFSDLTSFSRGSRAITLLLKNKHASHNRNISHFRIERDSSKNVLRFITVEKGGRQSGRSLRDELSQAA